MNDPREGVDELVDNLAQKQNNLQPHEIIKHGSGVDDVFWNGPQRHSRVQQIGSVVYGAALLLMCLIFASTAYESRSVLAFLAATLLGGVGLRVIYKGFKGRTVGRESR
jgi:hypothetical protein